MRRILAAVPALVGVVILAGWLLDIESVERLGLSSVSMNPMTAVCFVLLGVGLILDDGVTRESVWARAALGLYGLVAIIAALKLLDVLAGVKLGIDTTLFAKQLEGSLWQPNRMAPNTALCLLLAGCGAALAPQVNDRVGLAGQVLAIFTGAIALFALVGYMYGVTAFYAVPAFIPMAAHTGLCFLFVASAILAGAPERGVMAPISDTGFAGRSARLLLPAAVVIPLVLGWLRLEGERAGLYPSEVGVALMITGTVLILMGLTWLNSRSMLDVDRRRLAAQQALRRLNEELEERVRQRTTDIAKHERFLSAILANMQDAMIVNRGGKIVFANDACLRLAGARDKSELVGRSIVDSVHPDYREMVQARNEALAAGPTQVPAMEGRVMRVDGTAVEVEVTSASFMDDDEMVIISMIRDLTQRKLMERQLQHSQRLDAIGQLTGGIAHDFNNLLVVITGNLDLLEGILADNPRALGFAEMAAKAAWRGAELTRQLLAFSRKQSLDPQVVDVNTRVADTAALLRRTIGDEIELTLNTADGLWPAFVDPTQLESALTNLAINARDAMPNGGKLIFETANKTLDAQYAAEHGDVAPGDYVMVAVSDTGSGIPREILNRVFEPFFTTKPAGKGTGLGLAMIYGFVKQSRGHVKIYSEVGHGTTVRIYLPRGAGAPSAARDATADLATAPANTTVLVVEDNPDVRRVAAEQLMQLGYQVIEAEDGPSAIAALKGTVTIDLLFTDAVMPGGMTGIDLATQAPQIKPGIKVLLTSGFAEGSLHQARAAKAIPLLSKPYRKQDLAKKVRDVLQGTPST